MSTQSEIETTGIFKDIFYKSKENAVIIMNSEGIVSEINPAFSAKFGYKTEDVRGKYFNLFFTDEDIQKGLPEKELQEVKQVGSSEDHNYLLNKDRSKTWVSGESISVKNNNGNEFIIKIIQDIHEIKELQFSLQNQFDFSENILTSIDEAIIVIDENLIVHKVNQAFFDLFNISPSFSKKLDPEIFPILNDPAFENTLRNLIDEGIENEMEIKVKEKVLLIKLNILPQYNNPARFLLMAIDHTDKVLSDQKKDDMIAFVTHELRNPLNVITLCNELMEDSITDDNHEESLMLISKEKENLNRLKLLISELHEATKAGTGNLQFETSVFNFKKVVSDCIETENYIYPDYIIKCKANEDINVTGDSYRIGQVITNYLTNAIKYSGESKEITVDYRLEEGELIFYVKDFGLGIPEEQKELIFERYYRSPQIKNKEGLGMGLYLSKEIIKNHGGEVWVESNEGKGSVFYFSLPASKIEEKK